MSYIHTSRTVAGNGTLSTYLRQQQYVGIGVRTCTI